MVDHIAQHPIRLQATALGELARLVDGGFRDVQPGHFCTHARKRESVLPEMALQVQDALAQYVAEQFHLQCAERVAAGDETLHVVAFGAHVQLCACVPRGTICVEGVGMIHRVRRPQATSTRQTFCAEPLQPG